MSEPDEFDDEIDRRLRKLVDDKNVRETIRILAEAVIEYRYRLLDDAEDIDKDLLRKLKDSE